MKTFYRKTDNSPAVFKGGANIEDWPDFSETPVEIKMSFSESFAFRLNALQETDWWAVQDRTMTQEQIDYRQALRDISDQSGFPDDIVWPEKPEISG